MSYANIAIVDFNFDDVIMIESISVFENECRLSGAWEFPLTSKEQVINVIGNSLILVLGNSQKFKKYIGDNFFKYIEINSFLLEARQAVSDAHISYVKFKEADLGKRKKLVVPDFYDWPEGLDLNRSIEIMESLGRMAHPHNTPENSRRILATSRLVKFLIDMWHSDEQKRKTRKYVDGDDAVITILPICWLNAEPAK